MSLLRLTGFETGALPAWLTPSSASYVGVDAEARTGAAAMRMRYGEHATLAATFAEGRTYVLGFAWKLRSGDLRSTTDERFLMFSLGNADLEVVLAPDNSLRTEVITDLSFNNYVAAASASLGDLTAWKYVEVKYRPGADPAHDGVLEIRVDGVTVLSLTGWSWDDTYEPGTESTLRIEAAIAKPLGYDLIDDLYLLDDQGSANTDYLGPCVVEALAPASSDPANAWVGSDGDSVDNHLLVDDWDESDHVASTTPGAQDRYGVGASGVDPSYDVAGVAVSLLAAKAGADAGQLKALVDSNGTVAYGPDHNPDASVFAGHSAVFATDPATGALWTPAAVEAAQYGAEVV